MTDLLMKRGATISPCGKYRYLLWREWRGIGSREHWRWYGAKDGDGEELGQPKACLFIMLNPSTADGEQDDPTIRRCVGFARAWKFDRLEVVNLFAYRATDPQALLRLRHDEDPVGVRNSNYVTAAAVDAGRIICAWGAHGRHLDQDETLLGWLPGDRPCHALGLTKEGAPRHPLYAPADATLIEYRGRR